VNIGGWLTTEPFIAPALYEKYVNTSTPALDEWTLTEAMRANNALSDLENHYATFITEKDFAEIAGAGLNYVRIPLPYWAIEVRQGEPFLPNTAWTYFLKAIRWARKYGIRINLDLVSAPFKSKICLYLTCLIARSSWFAEWLEPFGALWQCQFPLWCFWRLQCPTNFGIHSSHRRIYFSTAVPGCCDHVWCRQ
jgi:hypothetical protein